MKRVELVIDQPVWFSRTLVVEIPDELDPMKSEDVAEYLVDERLPDQVTLDKKSKWSQCEISHDQSMYLGPVEIVEVHETDERAECRIEPRVFRQEWQEEEEDFREALLFEE